MAYDAQEWSDLFVAAAGASAALAGLIFVAVSINVERILSFDGLPERAIEALTLLVGVLLLSIVALIPGQGHVALGAELLAVSLGVLAVVIACSRHQPDELRPYHRPRFALRGAATAPAVIGAASVLAAAGGGLYWIAAAIVCAIVASVANAWVLLVEILR